MSPASISLAGYRRASRSPSIRQAYSRDWAHFDRWCATRTDDAGQATPALPAAPQTIALYVVKHAATPKPFTLTRR